MPWAKWLNRFGTDRHSSNIGDLFTRNGSGFGGAHTWNRRRFTATINAMHDQEWVMQEQLEVWDRQLLQSCLNNVGRRMSPIIESSKQKMVLSESAL